MLLTDGESNRGRDAATVGRELKAKGITIFSIGLGGNIKEPELDAIATTVENHKFLLSQLGDVKSLGATVKGGNTKQCIHFCQNSGDIRANFGRYSDKFRASSGKIWVEIGGRFFFFACRNILSGVTCRISCTNAPIQG